MTIRSDEVPWASRANAGRRQALTALFEIAEAPPSADEVAATVTTWPDSVRRALIVGLPCVLWTLLVLGLKTIFSS